AQWSIITLNGHAEPSSYIQRLDAFRKSDAERDALVAEIIQKYDELRAKYEEKCDDYHNEVESRRMWQVKAKEGEKALTEHKKTSSSSNFALCLLDGDGAVFADYLYALSTDGGAEAALALHAELRNQLKQIDPDQNVADWSIGVQVILNTEGLGRKLQSCRIIDHANELVAFGRAFGLAQPLFSFIDVGAGKERADHKIRETLRLFLPNAQCKHVFFGPCHDNGYLPVLESYRRDSAFASKMTLIETTPAEPGFKNLGLNTIRIPQVFRAQSLPTKIAGVASPLPVRTDSTPMTGNNTSLVPITSSAPPKTSSRSPAPSANSTNDTGSWAAVGKNGAGAGKTINIAPKKAAPRKYVLTNVHDERLDERLPEQDLKAHTRFLEKTKDGRNFCNNHHLYGHCPSGEYCDYMHGGKYKKLARDSVMLMFRLLPLERLTGGELLVLKHKARSLACANKYNCRDVNCASGHHCKFGRTCHLSWCRFYDTHDEDMEPAKKIYEDGTEEWLPSYMAKFN
ncbi:C-x8-c-x5-c-x3-h type zinc finger protein, partial [Teratosphaeria destructans]